jgi:hypothetical protein
MVVWEVSAQWSERRADLSGKEFRLFPRRKVIGLIGLMEINEVVITSPGPTPRRAIDLARKYRHSNRERDVPSLLLHRVKVVVIAVTQISYHFYGF